MAKTAILSVRIISDAKKAVEGFQKTSTAARMLDGALNVAKAGLLATGAAATAFTVSAVKDASNLEQSSGAVAAVFGDQSAAMEQMSADAATNLGLTKNEFNELATVMGSQLKNGGTAMEDLAPKTQELIGMGADLAAMFGGTTTDAVGALSSALRGERDPIEKYGVSLNQAAIDAKAAELGFEKVGGALSAEANQAATLALIMEQTTAAHGAFAREGNTLATQQQILSAQWGNLSAQVGGYLLPVLTALVTWANTALIPWLVDTAAQIPVVVQHFREFGASVSEMVIQNLPLIQQIATVVGVILIPAFIRLTATTAVAVAAQVAGWALSGAKAVATGLIYAVTAPKIIANWVMMGLAAVKSGAQTAAIWLMYQLDAVKAVAAHIAARIQIIASWVMMGLAAVKSGAQTAAIWLMYQLDAAKAALAHAATAARIVAGWVLMGVQAMLHAARMAAAWFIALGPVGWVIAAVIGLVAVVVANWDKVSAWTKTAWEAVVSFVSGAVTAVVDWVSNAWNNVVTWTRNVYEDVRNTVFTAMVKMVFAVKEKGGAVITWFRELPGKIKEKLVGMAESLKTIGGDMIRGLIAGIKGKAGEVVSAAKGVVKGAVDGAKKLLGIKSPSRVFRNDVGAQIGAGLAIGIAGTASKVRAATRDMLSIPETAADSWGTRPVQLKQSLTATGTTAPADRPAPTINITINGAIDKIGTARELRKIFKEYDLLMGEA